MQLGLATAGAADRLTVVLIDLIDENAISPVRSMRRRSSSSPLNRSNASSALSGFDLAAWAPAISPNVRHPIA
jgi:hypothetical protein